MITINVEPWIIADDNTVPCSSQRKIKTGSVFGLMLFITHLVSSSVGSAEMNSFLTPMASSL